MADNNVPVRMTRLEEIPMTKEARDYCERMKFKTAAYIMEVHWSALYMNMDPVHSEYSTLKELAQVKQDLLVKQAAQNMADNAEEVVSFPSQGIPRSEHLIPDLEALLERAKSGELTGIAYVATSNTRHGVEFAVVGVVNGYTTLGGVTMLQDALVRSNEEASRNADG